jgi:hypothetical protein
VAPSKASASRLACCAEPMSTRNPPANLDVMIPSTESDVAGMYWEMIGSDEKVSKTPQ